MSDATPLVPPAFTTFIAFDFGLKRTGVAVGNRLMRTAQPQGSIHAEGNARFDGVAAKLKEWQPDAIVIGVPYHPDGACKCLRWTSATAPPRRLPVAPKTPTPCRPALFWNNF